MDNIQTLLNEVNVRVHGLQAAKELYSEQLAPDFLVFDYLNTYETGLSKILADLLNPNGTHGQKTLFWKTLSKSVYLIFIIILTTNGKITWII